MSDRGMKKWAPYKSLVEQDFNVREKNNIEKPITFEETKQKINYLLNNYQNKIFDIVYFNGKQILKKSAEIIKIDKINKKIYLNDNDFIKISSIIDINEQNFLF